MTPEARPERAATAGTTSTTGAAGTTTPRAASVPWAAFALDVVLVLVFATIGWLSHAEGVTFGGLVTTASPFLAGTVGAWALLVSRGRPRAATIPAGLLVWAMTLVVGMALRAITGQGVALSFVLVAGSFTALTLIGWRALGAWLIRRNAR